MADNSPPPSAAPIFIVGFSRSGTSLLRSMLNAHQNIYISQESGFYQWLSPDRLRGSVVGVFTLTGAVGILVASVVGGYLFDHWMKAGPFVFFGLISALVLVWTLVLRSRPEGAATAMARTANR